MTRDASPAETPVATTGIDAIVANAGLPPLAAETVRGVVRGTRLWRREQADVAAELISHFADALETGTPVETIVEEFGDTKNAARLIRRARKRNRPFAWKAVRASVFGVFGIVGLYVLYGVYFLAGRPSPSVDYIARFNAATPGASTEEHAWPLYREALLALEDEPVFKSEPRPGDEHWDEMARYLRTQAGALEQLRQAAKRPALGFVHRAAYTSDDLELWPEHTTAVPTPYELVARDSMLAVKLPYLGEMRRVSKLLALDTLLAAEEGDGDRVVDNIDAMLSIARHSGEAPIIISTLVAGAIVAKTTRTVGDVLLQWPDTLSDTHLQGLARRIASCDDTLRIDFAGERMFFQDLIQRIYTDNGNGDGHLTRQGLRMMSAMFNIGGNPPRKETLGLRGDGTLANAAAMPALGLVMLSRKQMLDEYHRLMDQYDHAAGQPLWELDPIPAENEIAMWMSSPMERMRRLPLVLLFPAMSKAVSTSQTTMGERDGMVLAIGMELYRRRHGTWPAAPEDLVPEFLPEVPLDRFDGQPLRYAIVDGRPLIYSVGTDRDDDGGRPPMNNGQPEYDRAMQWYVIKAETSGVARVAMPDWIADGDWIIWPKGSE